MQNDIPSMKTGQTGVTTEENLNDGLRTFALVFMAVIWRRVWITTTIYCEHNNKDLSKEILLKCLKYNILSDSGIGNTLKPYIKIAFTDGFIMPQVYKKNLYATRAIMMYKEALGIVKQHDPDLQRKFVKDYALSIFHLDVTKVTESAAEIRDTIDNTFDSSDTNSSDDDLSVPTTLSFGLGSDRVNNSDMCKCKLCTLVNAWDINIALVYSEDPFQNIIMNGLMGIVD